MRIKIILYVIFFTYLSLIFIMNAGEKPHVDFIFFNFKVSLVVIFFTTILFGLLLGLFIPGRKISRLKLQIKELKNGKKNPTEK